MHFLRTLKSSELPAAKAPHCRYRHSLGAAALLAFSALSTVWAAAPASPPALQLKAKGRLVLLGTEVAAGRMRRLTWTSGTPLDGFVVPVPVIVVNGRNPGPVICLTGAIHGDELNGIEVARRVVANLDPEELGGAVIAVPIVNLQGFYRGTRYMPDRRDLNRSFPGNAKGSATTRTANSFFTEIIKHCSAVIDLHTGSLDRTNLPQIRADMRRPAVAQLTQFLGSTVVLHAAGETGSLRRAAGTLGIPAVTFEMGEPMRVQAEPVEHGVKAIETLLFSLGMTKQRRFWGDPESVYYASTWVRVNQGGLLFSDVGLGERVSEGELLGTVTDPISNEQFRVYASVSGRVLGMALNQVVLPGFAAYRLGIESAKLAPAVNAPDTEADEPADDEDVRPD
jgi:predicted deacylase